MTLSFPYTEAFDYECAECGFCDKSAKPLVCCSACGSEAVAIRDEVLNPLRGFVSNAMVEIPDKGFWVANVPVSQMIWRLIMGDNPSRFKGDDLPVVSVSFNDFLPSLNSVMVPGLSGSETKPSCRSRSIESFARTVASASPNSISNTPPNKKIKMPLCAACAVYCAARG